MQVSHPRAAALRVLLVEDNEDDAFLMMHALTRAGLDIEPLRASTEREFRDRVAQPLDAILTDYTIPGFGASRVLDLCRELRIEAPCIVVTGSIGEEVAVDCMKRGAADYLLKDRLARLPSALMQAVNARAAQALQVRTERSRDAAMRELDHRVRNNLAVVVGLAELTLRDTRSVQEFSPVFMGRVRALAAVHDALGEHRWLHVDLLALVMRLVAPLASMAQGSLEVEGEPVAVAARSVQPLGLALHELARDTVAQGAWSTPSGRVRLSWSGVESHQLDVVWEEQLADGAGTPHMPAPSPFLALANDLIRHETRGSVESSAGPDGRCFRIRVPLEPVAECVATSVH